MPPDQIFEWSSADCARTAAPRRAHLGLLILLVLLLVQAVDGQASAEVLWAVGPFLDVLDTDDGDHGTPPNAGSVDQRAGRPVLLPPGGSLSTKPSDIVISDQSSSLSNLVTQAPPAHLVSNA